MLELDDLHALWNRRVTINRYREMLKEGFDTMYRDGERNGRVLVLSGHHHAPEEWTPIPYWMVEPAPMADWPTLPHTPPGRSIRLHHAPPRIWAALAGRLTRSARRITLHLPKRWPSRSGDSGLVPA